MIDATPIHPQHDDIQTNYIDYVCPEWLLCFERFMITAPFPFQPDSLVGVKYSDEHRFFFPWQKRTDLSATKTISPSCVHTELHTNKLDWRHFLKLSCLLHTRMFFVSSISSNFASWAYDKQKMQPLTSGHFRNPFGLKASKSWSQTCSSCRI